MKKNLLLLLPLISILGLVSCQETGNISGEMVSEEAFESSLLNIPDNFTVESESALKWFGEDGNQLASSSMSQIARRDGRKYSCTNANQGTRAYGKTDGTYGILDQLYHRELCLLLDEETDQYGYYHYVGYERESQDGEWVLYGNRGSYMDLHFSIGGTGRDFSNFKFENGWYVYIGEVISYAGSGVDFEGHFVLIKYAFKDNKLWAVECSTEVIYDSHSDIPDVTARINGRSVLSYGTATVSLPEGLSFDPSIYPTL